MNEKYILICTDSIEGIFTGVYDGWKYGNEGAQVELRTEPPSQPEFFSRYETVESDPEKAGKVMRTIWRELGRASYEQLCYAACSTDEEKGTCIYYALRDGLSRRRGNPAVLENLKNPHILKISKLRQTVWHEMHRFLGFVRFQEIRDGILFAAICPDNAILILQTAFPGRTGSSMMKDARRLCSTRPGSPGTSSGRPYWTVRSRRRTEVMPLCGRHFVKIYRSRNGKT